MPESPSSSAPGATVQRQLSRAGDTDLTIVINDGSGSTKTWRLTCDPPGGTHPESRGGLPAHSRPTAQRHSAGAEGQGLYADLWRPRDGHDRGTWKGQTVMSTFARNDGCQISRWKLMEGLLLPLRTAI